MKRPGIKPETIKLLEDAYAQFNTPAFIPYDPISIPHRYTLKQDQEIMGFLAAILAWGQRTTIINNCLKLDELMEGKPYEFIMGHEDKDLERFLSFKHRTFQPDDLLYFIWFFRAHYSKNSSLETAFLRGLKKKDPNLELALVRFREYFFGFEQHLPRTTKHIASPESGSACKRINMFLRWMVRKDERGVDLGIWSEISASQLFCPVDVHVERIATRLGLLSPGQKGWKATMELTDNLKLIDPSDPVRFDLALFSIGVFEKTAQL